MGGASMSMRHEDLWLRSSGTGLGLRQRRWWPAWDRAFGLAGTVGSSHEYRPVVPAAGYDSSGASPRPPSVPPIVSGCG